ncbi:MAG TPA: hypothetical protein VMN39_01260 [Longimicrobiaceae bacterium]|nr:hypothetical protein [Longimicrobiaceae bacterium]
MHKKAMTVVATLALFLAVPELHATETDAPRADVVEARTAGADAPAAGELRLTTIDVQQRAIADDAAAAQFASRGSFWWIVGAIVVGGLILAILL